MELFWKSLDNAPISIVFHLEMEVEVGVQDIKSRFTPRVKVTHDTYLTYMMIRVEL